MEYAAETCFGIIPGGFGGKNFVNFLLPRIVILTYNTQLVTVDNPAVEMKKILIVFVVASSCLALLRCKKDNNNELSHVRYAYELKLEFEEDSWPGGRFDWMLTDVATLVIEVVDTVVSVTSIQNEDGLVSPATQFFENNIESCTATWQQGESLPGYINITSAKGKISGAEEQPALMSLSITSSEGRTPRFTEVWTKSGTFVTGGESLIPLNLFYVFDLNNQTQMINTGVVKATLMPRLE